MFVMKFTTMENNIEDMSAKTILLNSCNIVNDLGKNVLFRNV